MTEYHFETHRPVRLLTEIGKGSVRVRATDTTETHVEISGRDADQVLVRQDGDQVTVTAPRQRAGIFGGDSRLDVAITVPTASEVAVRTGSADISVHGEIGHGRLKSGSGEVQADVARGPLLVETGSGNVRVAQARAELKVKSGSGEVVVTEAGGTVLVSTGSGDVHLGSTNGTAVVKTGSGDLKVGEACDDVTMATGSGDFVATRVRRGRINVKGASGDVALGIPAGTPVWTDISTVSGAIRSNLVGAGQPAEGEDHVEVRAKTVSGDVVLTQV
jgi:DUF4097 and DUF4098 domain-containing protein YvlB